MRFSDGEDSEEEANAGLGALSKTITADILGSYDSEGPDTSFLAPH